MYLVHQTIETETIENEVFNFTLQGENEMNVEIKWWNCGRLPHTGMNVDENEPENRRCNIWLSGRTD